MAQGSHLNALVVGFRRRWIWAAATAAAVMIGATIPYLITHRSATNLRGATATRGSELLPLQPSNEGPLGGKNYALLFATDDYQYWPHLNNPLSDAHTIAAELTTTTVTRIFHPGSSKTRKLTKSSTYYTGMRNKVTAPAINCSSILQATVSSMSRKSKAF